MKKLIDFLDRYLSQPMARLSEQRHLLAIRDGVISALPFIIIGSFFLIVAFPPLPQDSSLLLWAEKHRFAILVPYRLTMFIMSLYIAAGIGYRLAQSYQLDALAGSQLAIAALLLTIIPQTIDGGTFVLPMTDLGGHGLFVAMLVSIFAVEVLRFCQQKKMTIRLPRQVPSSVFRSFEALIPVTLIVLAMTLITVVAQLDLHALVTRMVAPLVQAGDSLLGVLIPVGLTTFFWSFGIHGLSIVGTIVRPVWEVYLAKNAEAVAASKVIPHIAPEPFYQWFIWIGGSGATLGLVIAMFLFSKSTYSKTMARAVVVPAIFNINEPLLFGLPIILNPLLIIPFITVPLITATISYLATLWGFVHPTYILVPWTLPAPLGAYLATGGDIRALVLVLINIFLSFLIYLPFFKLHEKRILHQKQRGV